MKLRTLVVGAAALAMLASPAMAAKWVLVAMNQDIAGFIDTDSKTTVYGKQRAWFQLFSPRNTSKAYDRSMHYVEFGCSERNQRYLQVITFKGDKEVERTEREEARPQFVVPDTLAEDLMGSVCNANHRLNVPQPEDQTTREMADKVLEITAKAYEDTK